MSASLVSMILETMDEHCLVYNDSSSEWTAAPDGVLKCKCGEGFTDPTLTTDARHHVAEAIAATVGQAVAGVFRDETTS